ncbi:MAG: MBL fold metallo-hydrolase [Desulfobacterales bacterium]|jgi:L-ascorbate metabolism protein UlaG (beta-lactamase superfamily)
MFNLLDGFRILTLGVICMSALNCAAQSPSTGQPHHTADGFRNVTEYEEHDFWDFIKWRRERAKLEIPGPESYNFPLAKNDTEFLRQNRDTSTVTWIGHATILLQMEGYNILTDPHFSERASPVQWAGPERVVPPGLVFEELPPIDIVVISHDHYDSLDEQTIKRLGQRPGGEKTRFYVPLGLKNWFTARGIDQVVEMDWWDRHQDGNLEIIAVPVQHWSKRSLFSRNKTLWAGWVINANAFRFFFVGDSGYTPQFKQIGKKLGPFDLAAIPIGAYEPRWFMARHHVNPAESVSIHKDIGSKKSVAIHWGTFILTDEPLDEPPEKLAAAMQKNQIPPEEFLVLKHGETIVLD